MSVCLKIQPAQTKNSVDIVAFVYYHTGDSKYVFRTNCRRLPVNCQIKSTIVRLFAIIVGIGGKVYE